MTRHLSSLLAATLACFFVAACDDKSTSLSQDAHDVAEAEYERGPHRGRMLRDGDFALEMTIFEDGVDPEFRVYAYRSDRPLDPKQISLSVELKRLGNRVDSFAFAPQQDFLRGSGVVIEPHSFDVIVNVVEGGSKHEWSYASYEGRTVISTEAAQAGGVKTEVAGAAIVSDLLDMAGRVEIVPEGKSEIRGRYPGRIVEMHGELGQSTSKGQILARIESSHSLQTYSLVAPIDGVIVEKNANTGDLAGERALFVVADPTKLHAEFFVYPRDAERIRQGQSVEVRTLSGNVAIKAKVEVILPTTEPNSQTLIAHVALPPSAAKDFRPGMGVEGSFEIASSSVPLAVRTKALQRFRDFTVVYARVADTYEVRMLKLGRRTPEWTEVLGGLEPGTEYVTDGAFLIRADIEKSGASHDH